MFLDIASDVPFFTKSFIFIHDCQRELIPESYIHGGISALYNRIHYLKRLIASKKSICVFTISETAKKDIHKIFGVSFEKIFVVNLGWNHILRINEDLSVFNEYPKLLNREFFYSVSSLYKHKNFEWIIRCARDYPDIYLLFLVILEK